MLTIFEHACTTLMLDIALLCVFRIRICGSVFCLTFEQNAAMVEPEVVLCVFGK